jgi:hypothetical protein
VTSFGILYGFTFPGMAGNSQAIRMDRLLSYF